LTVEEAIYCGQAGERGHKGEIRWQKDARQTRRQLLLSTINLGWWWGGGRIYELMPVPAGNTWWELRGGEPAGPVASSVDPLLRRTCDPGRAG
jgi:hypothetical protein